MTTPIQDTLNFSIPEPFLPTAQSLRVGDVLEGHSERAFPRPRRVVGMERCEEGLRVIYCEQVAGEESFGTFTLPMNASVWLAPPF
jgi:hypothetical protein